MRDVALPPPEPGLIASVTVPARDEEALIAACLDALAGQTGIARDEYEVIVVLDDCSDATADRVEEARLRHRDLRIHAVAGPGAGAGAARATGMDLACERLERVGAVSGLVASTDADTVVAPDWLAAQLRALEEGAQAIGGDIELDPLEEEALSPRTRRARNTSLARRTAAAQLLGPADHPHFAGASLGLTPVAYRRSGGMSLAAALEDAELEQRLHESRISIVRPGDVRVTTSGRVAGRAQRGLAVDLGREEWMERRTFDGRSFDVEELLARKSSSVSVVLPAKEVAGTIGPILDLLVPHRDSGLVDELVVVDAGSGDGTGLIAADRGATVFEQDELSPELGTCLGKGDAMWRAARECAGDVLVFIDADTADFDSVFLTGMLGPIFSEPGISLVKASFDRPFASNGVAAAGEGGRVTELMARPLLNLHFPALAGFDQPLAGEISIRRDLFEQLSVPVGYGVEIAMLIDALRLSGIDALAQSRLGTRQNAHQDLRSLSGMAHQVLAAVEARIGGEARKAPLPFVPQPRGEPEVWHLECRERPPLRSLVAAGPDAGPELANAKGP